MIERSRPIALRSVQCRHQLPLTLTGGRSRPRRPAPPPAALDLEGRPAKPPAPRSAQAIRPLWDARAARPRRTAWSAAGSAGPVTAARVGPVRVGPARHARTRRARMSGRHVRPGIPLQRGELLRARAPGLLRAGQCLVRPGRPGRGCAGLAGRARIAGYVACLRAAEAVGVPAIRVVTQVVVDSPPIAPSSRGKAVP